MSQTRDHKRFTKYCIRSCSWLAGANDTAAHYAAIHCQRQRITEPAEQPADIPLLQPVTLSEKMKMRSSLQATGWRPSVVCSPKLLRISLPAKGRRLSWPQYMLLKRCLQTTHERWDSNRNLIFTSSMFWLLNCLHLFMHERIYKKKQ